MPFPFEFLIFGLTLFGVFWFHHHNQRVALLGLVVTIAYKFGVGDVPLVSHFVHEAPLLLNLFGLLVGFELLSDHFRKSRLSDKLPAVLPDDWKGGFTLLAMIFVLSTFLDNIAAAMIGASIAAGVFQGRVTVGYLAGIIAASNAGGAGSVIGDTTTTMMWIAGVDPFDVLHALLPSVVALFVFGVPISIAQDRYHRIRRDAVGDSVVDWGRLMVVALILIGAIAANVLFELPAVGVWFVIILTSVVRKPEWGHVPKAVNGAVFLLALVSMASLMPVHALPPASPQTAFGLGMVSAVFDNIPLTKLALDQGGYDWGFLAFAVGFGGSMTWFGSSAGVSVSNDHARIKDMMVYLREGGGWIALGYLIGFAALYGLLGWHPHAPIGH